MVVVFSFLTVLLLGQNLKSREHGTHSNQIFIADIPYICVDLYRPIDLPVPVLHVISAMNKIPIVYHRFKDELDPPVHSSCEFLRS